MDVSTTNIEGLLVIQPKVFGDERGYFFESFRDDVLNNHGVSSKFVQDNQSKSNKGILRGLHFQKAPHAQGKLVRVVKGSALDIALDIRTNSPTYGHHFSIELNEVNKTIFYIPPGFAHGFVVLSDYAIFHYKCTDFYDPDDEGGILWNDSELEIDWRVNNPMVSSKDKVLPTFKDVKQELFCK